jgi:hypothetical protein
MQEAVNEVIHSFLTTNAATAASDNLFTAPY